MARYALVIGIAEYHCKHLADLSKPVEDAEAIAELLKNYGQCNKEPTVLKGKVTTQQLGNALKTFLHQQAVNSEAIIYFTGHGISVKDPLGQSQGFLTTSDCDVIVDRNIQAIGQDKAIPFTSLNSLIQDANLSSLVMLIDACHSGGLIKRSLIKQSFSAFSDKQDHFLIAACRDFEEALAKKSDDHSLFTGAVLNALVPTNADNDGFITCDRLFADLSQALKGSRQEPVRSGEGRSLPIVWFPAHLIPARSGEPVYNSRLSAVPLQMPPLPDHFVERPEHQSEVKGRLLCDDARAVGTLVVSAIYGLGGIGKSVLAAKLAHDDDVQSRFADGILWATLGQSPDLLPLLSGWIQALGDHDYKPTAIESASNHLRTLLYDKRALLVVDDVWHPEHLEPFRVGGDGCCVLVTTREARIPESHRYDLDVMTSDQAMDLMTQKLSEALTEDDREQALAFAERVGYLPLALELAASQIEEGVSWQELFEDFQAEVVRLEGLDLYDQDEIPDDAKRRKYSLLACFNLSLKQLSTEQLRQFAWLGIVPEDVSLTQEMAMTLWQVTSRQAGSILRIFRSKALVLQGAKQPGERPTYRMHDLMHDLAQRLLVSSPQPLQPGDLPGLGMTKAEAHSEFINRYRAKTQQGQWHTLEDDGYIYAHLTWHMEQAKQPQEIHRLLQASNEQGRNGWYDACDAIGKPAGFINDVGRAWQLVIEHYEQAPGETMALLFRYALMRTSINSLASNVPAELVGALVKNGIWQAAQGLAYAQQAQDPWHRAACISTIVPCMPKALLSEVLKTVAQIKDAAYRSYVLGKLAERFPEVWPEVLATIPQIHDRYGNHRRQTQGFSYRALALSELVKVLPSEYLFEALKVARQIQDESDRSFALIAIARHLPELWPEALKVARQIQDESDRSFALIAIAQHLPELWPKAIEATRQIQNKSYRSFALKEIAQHLPELWPEAIEATRQIQNESARSFALIAIAQHLPELWPEAIEATRQIQDKHYRSSALREIAQHLPKDLLPQAIELTRQIQDESDRSFALIAIAQHLPELWPEALKTTRQIQDEYNRSMALIEIAQHLPELWPEAIEATRQIQDEYNRPFALRALAQHLPKDLLPQTLEATRQIQDEYNRSMALIELAQHLPELWPEALEATRQVHKESYRSMALKEIAQHLPKDLLPRAIEATRHIQNESERSRALIELAQHLPELWPEALEATRQVQKESYRSMALKEIAQHLPKDLLPQAIELTRQIQDESERSIALRALAQHLPELWPEALEATRHIQNESRRSSALSALAQHLPKDLLPQAIEAIRHIQNEYNRSRALIELAQHLPELWPEAIEATRQVQNEPYRSFALRALAQHLPKDLLLEVLEATRHIQNKSARSIALIALAQHLPELWPEALEATRQIQDESERSIALRALAQHLPKDLLPQAIETTRQIQDESDRSSALKEIAEHLPVNLLPEALQTIWLIQDKYYCASALSAYLPYLEQLSTAFADWVRILDILAYQNRQDLLRALPDIRPTIIRLGNEQAFLDTLQAVREVCQQWP